MTENEEYIFNHFLISIKSGFESLEDIIDSTMEAVEDEGWECEISEEWIRERVTREYNKNLEASKTWQHPTDTEKLHAAFDTLARQGIIALHNTGYTTSDAVYDAKDVWNDAEDEGSKPIGYCYYHGQDLERVIETDELMIGFSGAKANNDKEAIIIGHKVVDALKAAGLTVEWNNTASTRISVQDFVWKNVFTSDEDVEEKWGYDRVLRLIKEA